MLINIKSAECEIIPRNGRPSLVMNFWPVASEVKDIISEDCISLKDRDSEGNHIVWRIWRQENETTMQFNLDNTDMLPLVLREESEYFVEFHSGKDWPDELLFQQLLDVKTKRYASMFRVPRQKYLWLLKTTSSAGILPFSIDDVTLLVEVRPEKIDYYQDYKTMITDLTENGLNFLMDPRSPAGPRLQMRGLPADKRSPYLMLVTIDALFNRSDFLEALMLVRIKPHRELAEQVARVPINLAKGLSGKILGEAMREPGNILELATHHPLHSRLKGHIPRNVNITEFEDSLQTDENRFLAYVLDSISFAITNAQSGINKLSKKIKEAGPVLRLVRQTTILNEKIRLARFSEPFVGLESLPVPPPYSTILSSRSGYREIYAAWGVWNSGTEIGPISNSFDLYGGSKLLWEIYESWCLLALQKVLQLGPIGNEQGVEWEINSSLWQMGKSIDGHPCLILKKNTSERSGKWNDHVVYIWFGKEFRYSNEDINGQLSSYSVEMEPDITIAKRLIGSNNISMLHFDAKYGKTSKKGTWEEEGELTGMNEAVKTTDIQKMHAYQDALNSPQRWTNSSFNTQGTFVLFPGNNRLMRPMDRDITNLMKDDAGIWHPGIGALPLRPGSKSDLQVLRKLVWAWLS